MDQRTVFVEKLSWPTAIHPWKDGVLVIAPPTMTWYRDTDHDGRHDTSETWSTGFGRSNVQGMANSLRWSVEGYLVGSTSSSGAELSGIAVPHEPLVLRGRDFRIDPIAKRIEPISGGGQHGAAINRWGDRFVTSNSDHLQQIIDLDGWLSKHNVGSLPIATRRSIAVDGPQAEVFRASPIEPWRIVRTRLRVSGESPGAIEGGGRAAGYFTGATGTWIMDDEAGFGVPGFDTALVCDVGSNLIHRKKLESNELFWSASRIDDHAEFVSSSDIWFRPVQLGDGPDGALYIADMYREVIEHPKSLPPAIKKHLDLNSGNDRGRIWRVCRESSNPNEITSHPQVLQDQAIAAMTNDGLVRKLSSSIAWPRRMAGQLLIERNAIDSKELLSQLVNESPSPATQILALHLLSRLGSLDDQILISAMTNPNPRVDRHAIQLVRESDRAELLLSSPDLLASLIERSDARLRLELAMTASSLPRERMISILQQLIPKTTDSTTRSVVIASASADSWQLFGFGSDQPRSIDAKTEKAWLSSLLPFWCQQLGADKTSSVESLRNHFQHWMHQELNESAERGQLWADLIAKLPSKAMAERFLACWLPADRQAWSHAIASAVQQSGLPPAEQERRIAWLRFVDGDLRMALLERLLSPNASPALQIGAIEACLWVDPKATASILLKRFSGMTPRLQEPVLLALVGQPDAVSILVEAIDAKQIPIAQITPTARQRMLNHPTVVTRKRFALLLAATETTDRQLQQVIESYRVALEASANLAKEPMTLERGQTAFQKNCSACHRIGQDGQDVGPPLKSLHEKSPEQLLISILDPNREVDPRFQAYSVLMDDGRVLTGVIREESANQIILAESGGKLSTVSRDEIEQVKGNGYSLMPTGLHQQLTPEAMSELIAWLRSTK